MLQLGAVGFENLVDHQKSHRISVQDSDKTLHLGEGQYQVMLADASDLDELFALRYDVFLAHRDSHSATLRDYDHYDDYADHLIVKSAGRIIATYRLMPTDRILNAGLLPYSSSEFDLSALLESFDPRSAVELGRSCVHPSHRNGAVPKLLWSSVAKYMQAQGRTEAFGCVSVFNASHSEANGLVRFFKAQGAWSEKVNCPALQAIEQKDDDQPLHQLKSVVPPLLRSYLTLGAMIFGGPSYDAAFGSHDFLIHFSTQTMSDRCRRSFFS